jgi:hypothetical protein
MRTPTKHSLSSLRVKPGIAEAIAVFGGVLYLLQAWLYSHSVQSILDEGAYLYKGYLYVSGQYPINQEFGPWSNKMPLSFLIPGSIQYVFGPGLGTGRYFSIVLSGLMLLGLWILARRLGNRWWAAGLVWFYTLNPALNIMYSMAVSQVLVACMLVWVFVFTIGENRSWIQICIGAILSGLILMTRINMFLVLPLVIIYTFWQHGKRNGIWATFFSVTTVIFGHLIFWPFLLRRYAVLIPREISPYLNAWRTINPFRSIWEPVVTPLNRFLSLLQTTRIHFTALFGALFTWALWPGKKRWKSESDFRTAVFLSTLFMGLLTFHIWVALGNDFCVYCLSGYTAFFSFIGLLLLILTFNSWRQEIPSWYQLLIIVIILGFTIASGFGVFETLGDTLIELRVVESIRDFPEIELIKLSKYLKVNHKLEPMDSRRLVPTYLGAFIGLLVLIWAFFAKSIGVRKDMKDSTKHISSFGHRTVLVFLLVGTILSPVTTFLSPEYYNACSGDTIASSKAVGEHLASLIPSGSKVYWDGGDSIVPLLYVPGIEIYPAQINGAYTYKIGGESERLLKLGLWNLGLAYVWQRDADFILVENRNYSSLLLRIYLESGAFEELESTPLTNPCDPESDIRVFRRKT